MIKKMFKNAGVLGAFIASMLLAPEVLAGTGGGFLDQSWTWIVDVLHGTGGRLIALFVFIGGLFTMAKAPMQGLAFIIVGFALWVAPTAIEGILTAVG
jgi:conjugal transfer pilus assembly protein TraA